MGVSKSLAVQLCELCNGSLSKYLSSGVLFSCRVSSVGPHLIVSCVLQGAVMQQCLFRVCNWRHSNPISGPSGGRLWVSGLVIVVWLPWSHLPSMTCRSQGPCLPNSGQWFSCRVGLLWRKWLVPKCPGRRKPKKRFTTISGVFFGRITSILGLRFCT